ncbi:MAG: hypothetical protein KAR47_16975 [Planctomycetes bacterium]|nr:hypothetical protein [Planctomycetota bacterium]
MIEESVKNSMNGVEIAGEAGKVLEDIVVLLQVHVILVQIVDSSKD